MSSITIEIGDNTELLKKYPDNYFDSVVTDAPYGLGKEPDPVKLIQDWIDHGYHEIKGSGFMNKSWDAFVPQPKFWKEVFRVLKPGGHLLCFFGTRTYDWGTLAIRLAGFEIRDMITWHYGSGFPKSLDIGKALDKALGNEREVTGTEQIDIGMQGGSMHSGRSVNVISRDKTRGSSESEGWGTALKPATENICMARKPIESCSETDKYFVSLLSILTIQICQLQSFASVVKSHFLLSQKELEEAVSIVQWNVEKNINTLDTFSVLMDTLQLESETNTNLNIVLSWLNTLAELYNQMNTFITETRLSPIIELKILSFQEWESIFQNIIRARDNPTNGLNASVWNAKSLFNVINLKLKDTQTHSALEVALSKGATVNTDPICVARKPLIGTVVENVLKHGTGGINIDGCRIDLNGDYKSKSNGRPSLTGLSDNYTSEQANTPDTLGRFPANVIFDPFTAAILDEQTGVLTSGKPCGKQYGKDMGIYGSYAGGIDVTGFGDSGGASRFFYCAKASKYERNAGCDHLEFKDPACVTDFRPTLKSNPEAWNETDTAFTRTGERKNIHPTVKPIALMQYLQRLVTPLGGLTLDPFAGSGTSGCSAALEGFDIILMELDESGDYLPIIEARTIYWQKEADRIKKQLELENSQTKMF